MSILEIVMFILSVVVILASIIPMIISKKSETAKKQIAAEFFGHGTLTNALRALMKDKYNKKQTEVVATIVWRYSSVPLKAVLKSPENRYNIYQGLSNPNQYPWETRGSDYVK